jgi:hypothetical protein
VLRGRLRGLTTQQLTGTCGRLRQRTDWDVETTATAASLPALARRAQLLDREIAEHTGAITTLVRAWRPDLLRQHGVGPIVAANVLCTWSHAGRCPSDAAFAILGGAAPIPASSGQTVRVRLNRSGDRQLNQALHLIVLTRLRYDLRPGPMPNTGAPRARPTARSNAPWSATSPASSTDSSSTPRFDPTYERPCRPLSPARWAALGRADALGPSPLGTTEPSASSFIGHTARHRRC